MSNSTQQHNKPTQIFAETVNMMMKGAHTFAHGRQEISNTRRIKHSAE
jgi:hypothetical protein